MAAASLHLQARLAILGHVLHVAHNVLLAGGLGLLAHQLREEHEHGLEVLLLLLARHTRQLVQQHLA